MIAVDTNILVYAHRKDSPWHPSAYRWLSEVAEGPSPWAIPWPCVHELLAVVTNRRVYQQPTPVDRAIDQVEAWMEAPGVVLLGETEGYWGALRSQVLSGAVLGGQVHDARIAALCRHHGISTLFTADRDFSRFPDLTIRNPLVT